MFHQEKPVWRADGYLSFIGQHSTSARRRAGGGGLVELSQLRTEKCVGVWGSGHHRVLGQIGGARSFQVGSSFRGSHHARVGRCDACIEQSRKGGCETEVPGRQVSIVIHCGETSLLSGCGTMVQSTRVIRSVQSRYGHQGIRVGEASNPGPRVKRRRRVVESSQSVSGSDTEIDPDSTVFDDLEQESRDMAPRLTWWGEYPTPENLCTPAGCLEGPLAVRSPH